MDDYDDYYYDDFADNCDACNDNRDWKLDFVDHKIRIARQDYTCADCGKTLKKGTEYMDFATKYLRTRFCIECGKLACGGPKEI